MSIDGRIKSVETDGADLILKIAPRKDREGRESVPGQSMMRIVGFTRCPRPGMDIWGGDSSVEIVGFGWYDRHGYTRLVERRP